MLDMNKITTSEVIKMAELYISCGQTQQASWLLDKLVDLFLVRTTASSAFATVRK